MATAAAALVAPGKGILDAGESAATISARLTAAGVPATRENRRAYREMLITTPGLAEGVSGVILCDEMLRQHAAPDMTFPVALQALGMMAGIRVDAGPGPLAGTRDETVTEG
ncbi:MAG TPA: class I fructose-bisphosphate aldolase, partial [Streptosporangiaceae bacterium]